MPTTLAAWNIREGLAQPNKMPIIIEQIKSFEADVVVLGDAYSLTNTLHGSQQETLDDARLQLASAGYAQYETEYDDQEPWRHDRHLMMLSRLAINKALELRLSSRNALEVTVPDPYTGEPLRIVGAHFDDRSEATRQRQALSFLGSLDVKTPTVLAGNLNSARATNFLARFIRTGVAQALIGSLPSPRAESIGRRLAKISSGDTLELLERGTFRDADIRHAPTFPTGFPLLQVDHIMLSDNVGLLDFYRATHRAASDHSAVVARVSPIPSR